MKQKLNHQTNQRAEHSQTQRTESTGQRDFESVEEVLRYDAAQTAVPPELEQRVLKAAPAPVTRGPWWKRWLR